MDDGSVDAGSSKNYAGSRGGEFGWSDSRDWKTARRIALGEILVRILDEILVSKKPIVR